MKVGEGGEGLGGELGGGGELVGGGGRGRGIGGGEGGGGGIGGGEGEGGGGRGWIRHSVISQTGDAKLLSCLGDIDSIPVLPPLPPHLLELAGKWASKMALVSKFTALCSLPCCFSST